MAGLSTRWMGALSRSGSASAWAPRALLLVMLATVTAVISGACSGDDGGLPGPHAGAGGATPAGGTGAGSSSSSAGDACVEGEEIDCHITIGEHEGVLTCLDGVRRCVDGVWGACTGATTMRRSPFAAGSPGRGEGAYPEPFSNSDAGACVGNPCDPTCQSFDETPDGGDITIESLFPVFPWSVGDINAVPESVLLQGMRQPCMTGEDCQFDQYCDTPARGACSHDTCAPGVALLSSCSPCAAKVCAANPSCCVSTTTSADCSHDVCVSATGTGMTPSCDPCVANICAVRPACCGPLCVVGDAVNGDARCRTLTGEMSSTCIPGGASGGRCTASNFTRCPPAAQWNAATSSCLAFWGASCTSLVTSQCPGRSCGPTPQWSATCANMVDSVCGAKCDTDPPCAHDKCYSGNPLLSGCDPCVAQICMVDSSCCSSGWTQQCVDKVTSVCGLSCTTHGICNSYTPGQTDPACADKDLTLGVPCNGTVPVCNRGNTTAPAGIRINRYPAGSRQIPNSSPSRVVTSCSPTGGTLACTTAQTIPPGECINVTGCTGLSDGVELYVNPPGAGQVAECRCVNNGSIYQSGISCDSPGCVATASVSLIKQVTMFFAVDLSQSMRRSVGASFDDQIATRWIPVTNALKSFFADPASAGLGIALRFWPDNSPSACNESPSCPPAGGGGCATPLVPLGVLTADPAPTDTQENLLINAINSKTANGNTPMYPAMDGATAWAINRKLAFPDEEVAVVFVTDGAPTACNISYNAIAALARNAFYNYGVRVHALGIGNANGPFMQQMADAGGGQAYFIPASSTATAVQDSMSAALASIRGDALPCDVNVPVAGIADPSAVSVVFVNNAGTSTTLTKLGAPGACGNGWYFDPTNASNVKLCPQTCTNIRAAAGGRVRAVVPCSNTLPPLTTSWERYQASCPPGTKAQWGYLRYDTTTPSDSNVEFYARSADTVADLSTATPYLAATAHAAPTDTQVCNSGAFPPCAVDLFNALGGLPDARRNYLEVRMTLNPNSGGNIPPTVHDWEITYSCPDSE
jgi:hypothetical protein